VVAPFNREGALVNGTDVVRTLKSETGSSPTHRLRRTSAASAHQGFPTAAIFLSALKLSDWARRHGIGYLTAWRWFKAGKFPAPARQLSTGTILVEEPSFQGSTVLPEVMRVMQAFRFELDPNRAAHVALAKHVGAARFAYNWGLSRCLQALEQGQLLPSSARLHKEWNRWKRQYAPWWVEVSKCAPQETLRDLEHAFRNWRQGRAGRPRFKRKKGLDDNTARFTGVIRVCSRRPLAASAGSLSVSHTSASIANPYGSVPQHRIAG